jgi:hypothetical protein
MTHVRKAPRELDLDILAQPDDATCGPTCLHAVYRYLGEDLDLERLIGEVRTLAHGGTLAVNLANHALRRGYSALIYTYNLEIFDPTWFGGQEVDLGERLRAQLAAKPGAILREATDAYLEFLSLGGELSMQDLTPGLLRRWLQDGTPVLTGLSATFLYRCAREVGERTLHDDDIRGRSTGHFVVLCGWDEEERQVRIADPLRDGPRIEEHIYWMPVQRVINSILLGVLTYDANLLVLGRPEAPA